MKFTTAILLVIAASLAKAETHVCTTEAVSGASNAPDGTISASVYNGNRTFVYTQINEKWVVKPSGADYVLFDDCEGLICQRSDGYSGVFLLDKAAHTFTVTWFNIAEGTETWFLGKGRCTQI